MRRLIMAAATLLLVVVLAGAGVVLHGRRGSSPLVAALTGPPPARAPAGARIKVQVLNTTKTKGLARRATRLLRERGFDVVEIGTTGPAIDTSVVLDLSGHPDWADAAAAVMSPARTRVRADSSRYLDITVLIGTTWRPPTEPFHP